MWFTVGSSYVTGSVTNVFIHSFRDAHMLQQLIAKPTQLTHKAYLTRKILRITDAHASNTTEPALITSLNIVDSIKPLFNL